MIAIEHILVFIINSMSRYQFWKGLSILTAIYLCTAPKAIQYHSLSHTIKRSEVDSSFPFSIMTASLIIVNIPQTPIQKHSKVSRPRRLMLSTWLLYYNQRILQLKQFVFDSIYYTHNHYHKLPKLHQHAILQCTNVAKYNRAGATLTARRHPSSRHTSDYQLIKIKIITSSQPRIIRTQQHAGGESQESKC